MSRQAQNRTKTMSLYSGLKNCREAKVGVLCVGYNLRNKLLRQVFKNCWPTGNFIINSASEMAEPC
jgi:hypothetical protein